MKKRIIDDLIPRSKINLENKQWVSATYWNAIANADWAVGKVIESLKDRKLLNQVTIVILGDHGESLFDDGFLGHGHAINDSQTKIPLIINDPDVIADEPIGQVDIAEIASRSALGLPNHWANKDKIIFQLVGSLSQPALIAHVKQDGIRTLFDFRSERVFFSELKLWKPYEEALLEPVYKNRVVNLIRNGKRYDGGSMSPKNNKFHFFISQRLWKSLSLLLDRIQLIECVVFISIRPH